MSTIQPVSYPTSSGLYRQAVYTGVRHGSGSLGPFFAVIAVITVLTALACLFGRVFASGLYGAEGRYDCVRWMEIRCRSCIQGGMDEERGSGSTTDEVPVAKVVEVAAGGSGQGKAQGSHERPPSA